VQKVKVLEEAWIVEGMKHLVKASMACAQRVAHQPLRARGIAFQNRQNLAREAVGWMRVFGR